MRRPPALPTQYFLAARGAAVAEIEKHDTRDSHRSARAAPRGSELLVGVLGSGQVFGEVSVLDANQLSPVTVIAYTNVEMYAISKEHLHAQHASFNVAMNNFLNESMKDAELPALEYRGINLLAHFHDQNPPAIIWFLY